MAERRAPAPARAGGRHRCALLAAAWLGCAAALLSAATVELRVGSTELSVGQTVELQIAIANGTPQTRPAPEIPGLAIVYRGPSQVMQIVNGQAENQVILNYQLTAQRAGRFVIPALRLQVDNQWLTTQPVTLNVTELDPAALAQQAFLRLHLARTNVYAGELVPVQVELYAEAEQSGGPEWSTGSLLAGPWLAHRPQGVRLGGRGLVLHRYQTYLVAPQAGRFEVGPVRFMARVPAPNARRSLWFNEILDWRNVMLTNAPLWLTVRPLPSTNVPPHFAGAVGQLAMRVSVAPTNVAVGDPITVKVELTGDQMLLDSLRLPEQPGWSRFKVYPAVAKLENTGALGLGGRKIFEQVVVPPSTETRVLPAFQYSYFDPVAGRYQTLSGPEAPLVVRPSAGVTGFAPVEETNTVSLVAIKPHLGALAPLRPPWVAQPWFWLMQLAPASVLGAAWWWRRRLDHLAANPRLRRRRATDRLIERGVRELNRLARPDQAEAFYAAIFRLLQERLGERLDLPASAITEAVIEERLRPGGLEAGLLSDLEALFQACNQARYAPRAAPADLAALAAKTTAVLRALERVEWKGRQP